MGALNSYSAIIGLGIAIVAMPRADASPLETRIAVAGLPPFVSLAESDLKWSGTRFRLGGSAYYVLDNYAQATWWGQYEHPLTSDMTIGGLAGLNFDWWGGRIAPTQGGGVEPPTLNAGRMGYLIGAYFRQDWGRLWLKVAPSITLIPQDPLPPRPDQPGAGYQYRPPEVNLWRSLLLGGPSWLEVGYRLSPNVELSLQANWLSFIKISWIL